MKEEVAKREIESLDYYLQNHTNDYSEESHTAMMMAVDALNSSEKLNKWIPVSKRLPEENGRYLCTVGTDYRNPREMYYEPKGKNNRTWTSLDRTYVEDCFVIAWMPLPQPYKVESENN